MRVILAYSIGLVLVTILSAVILQPTLAISYTPGVKVGDSATYSLFGGYAGTTITTRMNVTEVQGTQVFVTFTDYPPDFISGFDPHLFWLDLSTGQSNNFTYNLFYAVLPGLNTGDLIFGDVKNFTVASLRTATCGGQSRSVVYSPGNFQRSGQSIRITWDRDSGIMCSYFAIDTGGQLQLLLDNTTIWNSGATTPADPYTTAAEVSAIVGLPTVALITLVFFRKRRSRR